MIGLVNTEGGSRILPSSDTVAIVILANDNVAGIVGFHPASRSVIVREGGLRFIVCKLNGHAAYTIIMMPLHLHAIFFHIEILYNILLQYFALSLSRDL